MLHVYCCQSAASRYQFQRRRCDFFCVVFSEALLLLLCSAVSGLELNPNLKENILTRNSSFSITCSGWSPVTWRYKRGENVPAFRTESRALSSVLHLENVTWHHTGVYECSEKGTEEGREVVIYVPGKKHDIANKTNRIVVYYTNWSCLNEIV